MVWAATTKNWLVDPNQGHYYVAFGNQLENNKKKKIQHTFKFQIPPYSCYEINGYFIKKYSPEWMGECGWVGIQYFLKIANNNQPKFFRVAFIIGRINLGGQ